MIIKAALVGLLYWISMGRAQYFFSYAFRKPIILGVFIGLVFGDVQTGLIYGATIQLMYMGGIEAGGNIPNDLGLASCIAIPAAIINNLDPAAAIAIAVPFGVLGVLINNLRRTINSFYNTKADAFVEAGEYDKLSTFSFLLPWLTNGVVMGKKQYIPFFVLGFFIHAISGFSMLTGAIIALCIALIVSLFKQNEEGELI